MMKRKPPGDDDDDMEGEVQLSGDEKQIGGEEGVAEEEQEEGKRAITYQVGDSFDNTQGSHKLWKEWKTWKITKKLPCMEKSWNLKKMKNHGILRNNMTKPPVARKLAVGHLCV